MTGKPNFHIRDVDPAFDDGHFIIDAFDSTLSHLASIGSGEQWGSQPFSEKKDFSQRLLDWTVQSEKYRLTGEGDPMRIFIAEVDIDDGFDAADGLHYRIDECGKRVLRVGAAIMHEGHVPPYVATVEELQPVLTGIKIKGPFTFLEVMVTDFRAGPIRKGSGAALINGIKEYALEKGMKTITVDCWAGNNRKLNKFYEDHGFQPVGDFSFMRGNGTTWLGTMFRMDL